MILTSSSKERLRKMIKTEKMENKENHMTMPETKKEIFSYIIIVVFAMLVGIGVSLIVKADIGLSSWDALALTFSYLTGIKIGTVGIVLNTLCVLGQFLIEGKDFKKPSLLQIPIMVIFGTVINFFIYNLLGNISFNNYMVKILVLVFAIVCISFSVSFILVLGKPTFPIESLCMAVHREMKIHYSKFRQIVDIVLIAVIVAVTFIFRLSWSLREGTVIIAVLFGPLLGIFMPRIEQFLEKKGIIDGKSQIEKIIEGEE